MKRYGDFSQNVHKLVGKNAKRDKTSVFANKYGGKAIKNMIYLFSNN